MKAIVDNDVIYKGLKGDLLVTITDSIPGGPDVVGVLGAAPYVLDGLLRKCDSSSREALNNKLVQFLQASDLLEPTAEELRLAAELERSAQDSGLPLDVGESQICAVAIIRAVPFVATGDKRAIKALEKLFDYHVELSYLANRVFCLEQLVLRALSPESVGPLRTAICSAEKLDITLSICFACYSDQVTIEPIGGCLDSYIADLRKNAPRVLAA